MVPMATMMALRFRMPSPLALLNVSALYSARVAARPPRALRPPVMRFTALPDSDCADQNPVPIGNHSTDNRLLTAHHRVGQFGRAAGNVSEMTFERLSAIQDARAVSNQVLRVADLTEFLLKLITEVAPFLRQSFDWRLERQGDISL
jgi:hypothetical protein